MFSWITRGSSLRGILEYNARKVNAAKAEFFFGNNIFEPGELSGTFDVRRALQSFAPCWNSDHRMTSPVFHASLSPHPKDKLTDEQLAAIAQEFMEKMGYGDQPYYVFRHRDIQREHLHIVSVRMNERGEKIDDWKEGERSRAICEQIEKKYGLIPTKGCQPPILDELKKVEYGQLNLKEQIASVVRTLVPRYTFGSLSELNTLLNLYNVRLEERTGEAAGKPFHGIVYSALDPTGQPVGVPIKSSRIGKDIGFEALERLRQKNLEKLSPQVKGHTREIVCRAMHAARTKEHFIGLLKEAHIDAVFRQNQAGRIYGVTFVDHRTRTVLNGSRLGKSYSANVFNELFNNPQADRAALLPKLPPAPKPQSPPRASVSQGVQERPGASRPTLPSDRTEAARGGQPGEPEKSALSGVASFLEVLDPLGIALDPGLSPEEIEEIREALQRKFQRRRKKKKLGVSR